METKVIFCCAVALCFDIVVSLPYTVDLQEYSGYKTRPALDTSYQSNIQRPYQYQGYDAYYKTTPLQKQEQQLPNAYQNYYFSRNQQRYLPKEPPQVDTVNGAYANQQNTYNLNRQVYESAPNIVQNKKESSAQVPQVVNTGTFYPAIPAVPSSITFDVLKRADNRVQPTKAIEIEIPVIQPPPARVENVPQVNNFDRFLARAANPVELVPEQRKPQKPIDIYLSHPRIRDVLATTKHQKRYLVIHPNGTVEHVDKLENIAKRHPNYHLVNAGDILASAPKQKPVVTTPSPVTPVYLPQSIAYGKPANVVTRNNVEVKTPVEKTVSVQVSPIEAPKTGPIQRTESKKESPSPVQVNPVVQTPTTTPPVITPAEVPITTTETVPTSTISTILPSVINIDKEVLPPQIQNDTDAVPTTEPSVATAETEPTPPKNEVITVAPIPAPITTDTPVVPTSTEALILSTTTEAPVVLSTSQVPLEPITTEAPLVPSSTEVTNLNSVSLQSSTANSTSQPDQNSTESPKPIQPSEKDVKTDALSVPLTEALKKPENSTLVKVITKPQDPQVAESSDKSVASSKIDDDIKPLELAEGKSQINETEATSAVLAPVMALINQLIEKEQEIIASENEVPVPEVLEDLELPKDESKPSVWFRTSDPNFWDKLSDKDKGLDVVYFFQIHNQPTIERNVKTTIHANGTVIEDVIESHYAFEGDEPVTTKTTKVIHPENL